MRFFRRKKPSDLDALIASVEDMAKVFAAAAPVDRRLTVEELFQFEKLVCEAVLEKPREQWASQGSLMRETIGPAIERRLKAEVHRQFLRYLPTNIMPEGNA